MRGASILNISGAAARLAGFLCVAILCVLPAYASEHELVRVSGHAVLSDGAPAAGATVTLMAHGGSAVAEADGSFVIDARVPSVTNEVSISALLMRGEEQLAGTASAISVDGGEAEVGVVTLSSLCEPGWVEGFGVPGIDIQLHALTVFDDGSGGGPALYAGGIFFAAGGVISNHIARWDGSTWSALEGPGGVGVNAGELGAVNALAVFDDGSGGGPALYAGGFFTTAGGMTVNGIARWDGRNWSALEGPGYTGVNGWIKALAVFDDGSGGGPALYAGGVFTTAGDVTVNSIARWDGANWSGLEGAGGVGVDGGSVRALTLFDDGSGDGPALYAGGNFLTAGGVTVNRIARWDGSDWSALAGPGSVGVNNEVYALSVFDDGSGSGPAMYAGGAFTTAGGVTVNRIARWDGSNWSALASPGGVGVSSVVRTLAVFDSGSGDGPALFAGGQFNTAGGVTVNSIARWDGSAWSALDGPGGTSGITTGGSAIALAVFDDGSGGGSALYVGGLFVTAGEATVNRIASWDGSDWSSLGGQGGLGFDAWILAFAVFDDGFGDGPALYAGGQFKTAGGMTVNRIARWDGSVWSALEGPGGTGVNNWIDALTVFDDGSGRGESLYAGGIFTTAGGVTVNRIARWDGTNWSTLESPGGVGVSGTVNTLTVFDDGSGNGPAMYAGGAFTTAGGVTVNRIARWDGSDWSALEGPNDVGMDGGVVALTVFDDGSGSGPALYAAGFFTTAGGVTVNRIARWDGTNWSALEGPGGVGVDGTVYSLTVFDDGSGSGPALYAGGAFTTAGGVTVNRIARWDGSDWSALEGPSDVGMDGGVLALTVFDDGSGSGPALYAGGWFTSASGVTVNRIARWDGSTWSAMAGPGGVGMMHHRVNALTVFDDGTADAPSLYVGGEFTTAGGVPSSHIAKWQGCATEPPCALGDLNCDGVVNVSDLLILLGAWGTCAEPNNCLADLNDDGIVNVSDLLILLANWG
jgi:hypothetical protein